MISQARWYIFCCTPDLYITFLPFRTGSVLDCIFKNRGISFICCHTQFVASLQEARGYGYGKTETVTSNIDFVRFIEFPGPNKDVMGR